MSTLCTHALDHVLTRVECGCVGHVAGQIKEYARTSSGVNGASVSVQWEREQIAKYGRDNPWVLVNVFGRVT